MDELEQSWSEQKNKPDLRFFDLSYIFSIAAIILTWAIGFFIPPYESPFQIFYIEINTSTAVTHYVPIFSLILCIISMLTIIYYWKIKISKISIVLNLAAFINCLIFYIFAITISAS